MLVVETVGRIRREHLVKGKSIKEIARDLKISRKHVRDDNGGHNVRSGANAFAAGAFTRPWPKPASSLCWRRRSSRGAVARAKRPR